MTELLKNKATKEQQNINTNKKQGVNKLYIADWYSTVFSVCGSKKRSVYRVKKSLHTPAQHFTITVAINNSF